MERRWGVLTWGKGGMVSGRVGAWWQGLTPIQTSWFKWTLSSSIFCTSHIVIHGLAVKYSLRPKISVLSLVQICTRASTKLTLIYFQKKVDTYFGDVGGGGGVMPGSLITSWTPTHSVCFLFFVQSIWFVSRIGKINHPFYTFWTLDIAIQELTGEITLNWWGSEM